VEVKTFTYKKLLGSYYLQGLLSSKKMDDHIAEMLSQGWELLGEAGHAGDGRTFGPLVRRDRLTITYKRA
jgi:hypothetical protein